MENVERAYTTKEVSKTIGVVDSTIRKWCLSMEKHGYTFTKNEHNQRLFLERDLVALRHYQTLVKENNFSMDNAGMVIASRFSEAFSNRTGSVPVVKENEEERDSARPGIRSEEKLDKLLEYVEKQEEFNQELLKRLDEQQQYIEKQHSYIENYIKERDGRLVESMRALQETKQEMLELAAAKEEEKEKSGFFARLFGK